MKSERRVLNVDPKLKWQKQTLYGVDGKPLPKHIKRYPKDDREDKVLCIYSPVAMPMVYKKFFLSFLRVVHPRMMVPLRKLGISDYFTHLPSSFPICKNRNLAVQVAKENKADYILMLDADMVFPPTIAQNLAEHELPIVSGIYHHVSPPHLPVIYKKSIKKYRNYTHAWDYDRKNTFDVDLVGAGCLWIDMKVFDEIKMPYFKYDSTNESGIVDVTEDVEFCEKVKEAGFSIVIDPKIQCGHLSVEIKTQLDYDAYLHQYETYQKLIDKFGTGGDVNIE